MKDKPQLSAEIKIPENLSQENAHKYLIMRSNLAILVDNTGTNIKNTILNDYWLELTKSQKLATALEEEREKVLSEVEKWLVDKPLVDYPNGQPKDDWLYGRDRGYNQALAELRTKLNQLKEGK